MVRRACEHGRRDNGFLCIQCWKNGSGGKGICPCGKQKTQCNEHGGGSLCPCGKPKSWCKEHGGGGFCPCGKRKSRCKEHGGSSLCPCGKLKTRCNEHGGGSLCPCGRQKLSCKEHGGGGFCPCGIRKGLCKQHGGASLCPCGKHRQACKKCNPKYFTHVIRTSVYEALKRRGAVKDASTLCLLGVSSFDQVKCHLEVKIKIWNQKYPDKKISMTTMAIDHIKPVAKFDDSEQAKKEMSHFTNLQPLPYDVNASKSAKWNQTDEDFWRVNIIWNPGFHDIYLP